MYVKRIGYLGYKLYRLGWQNAVCGDRTLLEHLLLSVLFYYRRGFASGTEWVEEYRFQENLDS